MRELEWMSALWKKSAEVVAEAEEAANLAPCNPQSLPPITIVCHQGSH